MTVMCVRYNLCFSYSEDFFGYVYEDGHVSWDNYGHIPVGQWIPEVLL